MSGPALRFAANPDEVYRVARLPDPWQWTPWQYAPFNGRWDDSHGTYRVIYTAASTYACFVEVLAQFRPDPSTLALMAEVEDDERDVLYPTIAAGAVTQQWVSQRAVGSAWLTGQHVDVGAFDTLAWLRPRIASLLTRHGIADLDGAVIRDAQARPFTCDLSHWLYELSTTGDPISGVHFESRHGNDLLLWATFERHHDGPVSQRLTRRDHHAMSVDDPAFLDAMQLHGLHLVD